MDRSSYWWNILWLFGIFFIELDHASEKIVLVQFITICNSYQISYFEYVIIPKWIKRKELFCILGWISFQVICFKNPWYNRMCFMTPVSLLGATFLWWMWWNTDKQNIQILILEGYGVTYVIAVLAENLKNSAYVSYVCQHAITSTFDHTIEFFFLML